MTIFTKFVSDDPEKSIKTFLLTASVSISILDFEEHNKLFLRLLVCSLNGVAQFQQQKVVVKQRWEWHAPWPAPVSRLAWEVC